MMTTKQQELLDLKRRQEELEIEIKIEEENRKKNMTNKELLQITDELLANFYKKQVILYHTNVKFIQDFYKQINKYQQTQPRGVWLDQEKQKKYYELWQNIKKFNNLRVGDVISVCNIINNDELTENVKKEIEKNLSDEYKLIRLLTRIVKNQEEKLNNS
jgi:hypothetical protein